VDKAEHCTATVPSHELGALYAYQYKRVIEWCRAKSPPTVSIAET